MNKLSLDAFKAKMSQEEVTKTEALLDGILGSCHAATDPSTGKAKYDCYIYITSK